MKDRAFAYLKDTDPEAAIRDYDAVLEQAPADDGSRGMAKLLRQLLKPTVDSSLFVFLPVGRVNGPAKMPDSFRKLGRRINLRFWWHPIVVNRIRYTSVADESLARTIAGTLTQAGLTLEGPVATRALVTHDRRIEVWVNERKE